MALYLEKKAKLSEKKPRITSPVNFKKQDITRLKHTQAIPTKFNKTLVAAFKQYGKAVDVGDSPMLTRKFAGGAMTQEKDHPGHFALGLDLAEISASNYKGRDQQPNAMQPKEIIRHELYHFVDFHPMESALKETRAVWFVNQFQMAEGRPTHMSYFNIDETYNPGIAPTTTGYNQRLEGVKIPGQNEFPEPSPNNHGWHPNHRQKEPEVHSSNET